MNTNLETSVEEVKEAFTDYFSLVGGKNFKQFYYDWHIDNMLAPFAGLVSYFEKNYGEDARAKFHDFVNDISEGLASYDGDKPQLSRLTSRRHSNTTDGKLGDLLDGVRTFGFEYRQFVYSFGTRKDHDDEFGYWPVKANMPYSSKHGLMVAKDVLLYLDNHFDDIVKKGNVYNRALCVADTFLRKTIAKSYAYEGDYTFSMRKMHMKQLHDLRNDLSSAFYHTTEPSPEMADAFQLEQAGQPLHASSYWPNGFELEFYVPEQYGDYCVLVDYLKEKNNWEKLYFTNKDPSVYEDRHAAGVIMRDESLAPYEGLAPVEFATRVMLNREDEKDCLKILDAFEKGHVNKHCSLHQHLSSEGFTLDVYKRLVKRMMLHEDEIVGSFAAPERRDNNLLYATYISRNLSSHGKRDYPFLCVMVDLCDSKAELEEMASFGSKYKTLNILPQKTIEMRAMNANFNKKFVEAYLQFNREFVLSAVVNSPCHLNRVLLNKYNWYNNENTDTKTVMHDLKYGYDFVPHDSYRPMEQVVSASLLQQEQDYARVVAHALVCTGKIPYRNTSYHKRLRGGGYAR